MADRTGAISCRPRESRECSRAFHRRHWHREFRAPARSTRRIPPSRKSPPTHKIRFAAIGLDHAHIYGMTRAIQRGGGELVSFYAQDPAQIAEYRKQFGDVKLAASEDEIIGDKSIQLVLGAPIPDLRAPLGIRVDEGRQGLPRRQARDHLARAARRSPQGHQGDQTQVRHHVFRAPRSALRGARRRARSSRARSAR